MISIQSIIQPFLKHLQPVGQMISLTRNGSWLFLLENLKFRLKAFKQKLNCFSMRIAMSKPHLAKPAAVSPQRFPITLDEIPAVRHPYINSGPRDSRNGTILIIFLLYTYKVSMPKINTVHRTFHLGPSVFERPSYDSKILERQGPTGRRRFFRRKLWSISGTPTYTVPRFCMKMASLL